MKRQNSPAASSADDAVVQSGGRPVLDQDGTRYYRDHGGGRTHDDDVDRDVGRHGLEILQLRARGKVERSEVFDVAGGDVVGRVGAEAQVAVVGVAEASFELGPLGRPAINRHGRYQTTSRPPAGLRPLRTELWYARVQDPVPILLTGQVH